MKADQKYSKVVEIKGGGGGVGGYINETKAAIMGGGVISMKSMNFRYKLSPRSKKSSIATSIVQ